MSDDDSGCATDFPEAVTSGISSDVIVKRDEQENTTLRDSTEVESTTKSESKYADWPIRDIKEPHENDVLYGRGGGTNHHLGNKRYRKMVEERKIDYVNCKRLDKPLVALGIIREWRGQDPPGRFLKLDEKTGLWFDVGDKKAREKTSQALREKAPQIRAQQEGHVQDDNSDSDDEDGDDAAKATRFASGTNLSTKDPSKPVLVRDHSLGREYLGPNDAYTLDGFNWREPLDGDDGGAPSVTTSVPSVSSSDYYRGNRMGGLTMHPSMPPPSYYPQHRTCSSVPSAADPYRYPGLANMAPPQIPHSNSYEYTTSGERHMHYSNWTGYDTWGSTHAGGPPVHSYHYPPQHTMSWSRDHNIGHPPLPHQSVTHPPHPTFENHSIIHGPPTHYYPPSPHISPLTYRPNEVHGQPEVTYPQYRPSDISPRNDSTNHQFPSSGIPPENSYQHYRHSSRSPPPPTVYESQHIQEHHGRSIDHPRSPSYKIDPAVASQWSGQDPREIAVTLSGGSEDQDNFPINLSSSFQNNMKEHKPDIVKRATSNQNETVETKPNLIGPSVKRAALNRDNSMASNRLKEQYIRGNFDTEEEVKLLSENFEQSNIGLGTDQKPFPISAADRLSTIDTIAMDLMVRPLRLTSANRSSTIEALALDFDDRSVSSFDKSYNIDKGFESTTITTESTIKPLKKSEFFDLPNESSTDDFGSFASSRSINGTISNNLSTTESLADQNESVPDCDEKYRIPRPPTIKAANRMTTTEVFALVNEPIADFT